LGVEQIPLWLGLLHAQERCQLQQKGFYEEVSIRVKPVQLESGSHAS
jgi:hypothetical protein